MDKAPELTLPVEIVEDYQEARTAFVNATQAIFDGLVIMETAKECPPNLMNEMARQLLAEFTPIRQHALALMSDYLATMAELHVKSRQFDEVSKQYNELVYALEHGDMTHDLTDAFLEEIHEALEMEWESDLLKAVMREQKSPVRVAEGIIAAIEGEHIPVAQRKQVATVLMRMAAKIAHSTADDPAQLTDGIEEAEIIA